MNRRKNYWWEFDKRYSPMPFHMTMGDSLNYGLYNMAWGLGVPRK